MPLLPGLAAEVRMVVSEADTATAVGSGDVPVLATPRLLALAESATVAAVRPHLDPRETTVGTVISLEHRAASPVGAEVVAGAELVTVQGRRLSFSVAAYEGDKVVGVGRVERTVVERARFLAGLR